MPREENVDMLTYYLRRFGKNVCPSSVAKLCPIPVKVEYEGGVIIDNKGTQFFGDKKIYKCPACGNELTFFQLPAQYIDNGVGFCPYCDQTIINKDNSYLFYYLFEKEKAKMYSDFFRNWCRNYDKDTWYI